MVAFVLNALALGYRPMWNAQRQLAGVQLFLHEPTGVTADVPHLLRILREMWSPTSPPLLLSPQSRQLLAELLQHGQPEPHWQLEVREEWLGDSQLFELVQQAHQRGLPLVRRGPLPLKGPAPRLLRLSPSQAIDWLQDPPRDAPVDLWLEEVHSRALMRAFLDVPDQPRRRVCGWPTEDVLHQLRGSHALQPARDHVQRLIRAIDADESLDSFEAIFSEDPLLTYRFLIYSNSAALGLRSEVDSLRKGLVLLGYDMLKQWLMAQLTQSSHDPDLQPVRQASVLRAQLTARLLDAGVSEELRSEVYLCGLLSRLDEVLDESLTQVLQRLPLSERILAAAVQSEGPYAPSLALAKAQENEDLLPLRQLCEQYGRHLEEVNRTLLRQLCDWHGPATAHHTNDHS